MNNTMKMVSVLALAAVIVLAGAGVGMAESSDKPKVGSSATLGNYLTDGKGMTLYYFKKDAQDKNSCTGPCLEKWLIYYADPIVAPAGSDAKDFGSFVRSDGKKQTTFKGWPLYYFIGDKAPGDTKGQGVKDVWYVINPISMEPCLH
jgi:predicted lipoprotein with Yx(FWY)xxD motif